MNKIWFILIDGKREGPCSFEELKGDARITPDTFVWKEGFEDWKKISDVPELKDLFKEEPAAQEVDGAGSDDADAGMRTKPSEGELTMAMQEPPYLLWILIALVSLLYVILQLQRS